MLHLSCGSGKPTIRPKAHCVLLTFLPDATGQHPYGLCQEPGGEKKREEGGTHAKTMEGTGPTDLVADSGDEVRGWCPLLPLPGLLQV